MKHGKNKPTADQRRWLAFLEGQGYQTAVCYSAEEAIKAIIDYLDLDKTTIYSSDSTVPRGA
jgi:hypothetical protein